jgi:hypothetical protein
MNEYNETEKVIHNRIPVFDFTLNREALLIETLFAENAIPIYILEYPDGKRRGRFYSEFTFTPVIHPAF